MKWLLLISLSVFCSQGRAEDKASSSLIEAHLKAMSKLNVFALKVPTRLIQKKMEPSLDSTAANSPTSCEVSFHTNNKKEMESSCDAKKTFKTETLNIAAN